METNSSLDKIEKWEIWEIELEAKSNGNPYIDVSIKAEFRFRNRSLSVDGFYDSGDTYKVRFMPDSEGDWSYSIKSNIPEMDGITGTFICIKASGDNHGPVRVVDTFHFAYEDGTRYFPVGTTCYAWTNQTSVLEEQTLKTLKKHSFNKMRMCVFPKHYDYNHNEPEEYPFEGFLDKGWDFNKINPAFFKHLETRVNDLKEIGIEADLIIFHPYDRWGFSKMSAEEDDRYLRYLIARLAAFRNIWWSLANEYDLFPTKTTIDWERFAKIILENDPYGHLRSIHNCRPFYDHNKPWITHCSIQRQDVYKTSEYTDKWREQYKKPIVIDECGYEGNINHGWGNITGQELTRRFWEGFIRGGYVGHGETYINPEEILWWSKGGQIYGESAERIGFLRNILEKLPEGKRINPISFAPEIGWDLPCGGIPGEYYLFYFGFNQPTFRTFDMPDNNRYKVDIIDTWNMTINEVDGIYCGKFRIDLPGKQYIAVRMKKMK